LGPAGGHFPGHHAGGPPRLRLGAAPGDEAVLALGPVHLLRPGNLPGWVEKSRRINMKETVAGYPHTPGTRMEFYAKMLILSLIQGAAELLPVSSSAHVILAAKLMGMEEMDRPSMVFLLIMLHTGTMFAAIVYFWSAWKALLFPPPERAGAGRRFVGVIVL